MKFEDMKKDIPETPEFIHTMIQNEVKKQLQDTQVVHIQKRKKMDWYKSCSRRSGMYTGYIDDSLCRC